MLGLGLGLTSRGRPYAAAAVYPWTPLDLDAALKAWWRASTPAVGAVVTWTDIISGVAPTQASGTLQPVKSATSFNSAYPGVTFDGTDDAIVTTTNVSLLPTGATGGEVWAVVDYQAGGAAFGGIVGYGGTVASSSRIVSRNVVSTVSRALISDTTANLTDTTTNFVGPHILMGSWSGTTESGRIDGAAASPASAVIASLNTATTRVGMGWFTSSPVSTFPGKFCLAECLVTTTLTAGQREQIEGWAAWTYGLSSLLPGGHPYKAAAPTITRGWQPTDLGVGLKAWWSADDHGNGRMTDDGAGLISSWKDKIGLLNLTAGGAARPTWAATSFNSAYQGLTVGASIGVSATNTGSLPIGTTDSELWAVCSQTAAPADTTRRYVFTYGNGVANGDRRLSRSVTTGVNRLSAGNFNQDLLTTAVDFTGPHIVGMRFSGTSQLFDGRIDGAATTPATATLTTMVTGATTCSISGSSSGGSWFGVVRHVFVTNALTTAQREQLEGWCAWDSGLTGLLPVGHLYKSARP